MPNEYKSCGGCAGSGSIAGPDGMGMTCPLCKGSRGAWVSKPDASSKSDSLATRAFLFLCMGLTFLLTYSSDSWEKNELFYRFTFSVIVGVIVGKILLFFIKLWPLWVALGVLWGSYKLFSKETRTLADDYVKQNIPFYNGGSGSDAQGGLLSFGGHYYKELVLWDSKVDEFTKKVSRDNQWNLLPVPGHLRGNLPVHDHHDFGRFPIGLQNGYYYFTSFKDSEKEMGSNSRAEKYSKSGDFLILIYSPSEGKVYLNHFE